MSTFIECVCGKAAWIPAAIRSIRCSRCRNVVRVPAPAVKTAPVPDASAPAPEWETVGDNPPCPAPATASAVIRVGRSILCVRPS